MFSYTKTRCYWFLWLCWFTCCHGQQIRVTDIKCVQVDRTFVNVTKCCAKPITKTLSETTINITLLQEATAVVVKLQFRKKSSYKYNPFFHSDLLIDGCKFLKNRALSPLGSYLFALMEDSTNLNHSCPLKDYILLDHYRVDMKRLKWIPIPPGDYLINFNWIINGQKRLEVGAYFTYNE